MNDKTPKNYGLVFDAIAPEDFILGSSQSLDVKYGDAIINPTGDWEPFVKLYENQDTNTGDTFACVPHGITAAIALLSRCRFGTTIDLSARLIAKWGGVKVGVGSSPKQIADYTRKNWSVLEAEWPDVDTVEEYYKEPPANLKTLAIARGAEYEFGYEWVGTSPATLKEALKRGTVCVSVPAWFEKDGTYYRPAGMKDNHWTTLLEVLSNGKSKILDSFPPYIKILEPECIQGMAQRYYLNKQTVSDRGFRKFIKIIRRYLGI